MNYTIELKVNTILILFKSIIYTFIKLSFLFRWERFRIILN